MVASALGRCLTLAVVGAAPESLEQAVVSVPDPAFVQVSLLLHPPTWALCQAQKLILVSPNSNIGNDNQILRCRALSRKENR